jgi:hypothetical protein
VNVVGVGTALCRIAVVIISTKIVKVCVVELGLVNIGDNNSSQYIRS